MSCDESGPILRRGAAGIYLEEFDVTDRKKAGTRADAGNPATAPSFTGTLSPGIHVVGGMGNALSVETPDGIIQVDTGQNESQARQMIASLREISDAPVHAIVHSHGHLGYNGAIGTWTLDAARRGDPPPRTIAHENLVRRWNRYLETEGLQRYFIELQFRVPRGGVKGPLPIRMPNETFREELHLGSGENRLQVLWAPSETDDAVAIWFPEKHILYGGAAVTPSIPNVGTPLRSLRDPVRWAETLERLADLEPQLVIMEFGPPLEEPERIQTILRKTAEALRYLRKEVVERLNRGLGIEEIIHDIAYPASLFDQPWMTPLYGCPEYIVRDIYRAETGWWDRNPTHLHPAHPDEAGAAILSAIRDRGLVLDRARSLAAEGKTQLALHVIDILALAPGDAPELASARALKAELCNELADQTPSFVSRSLYLSAARIIAKGAPAPTGVR
ncbi:MAG: MBL fold metallo-hydrolase [bacterium]|nr:MBL fold metallo-hydrolase [bacterium]